MSAINRFIVQVLLPEKCLFASSCVCYKEDAFTCNHQAEAMTYCGIYRTLNEKRK